ncbi:MAG TPA: PQQ-binding-like beta-propeller repeat protein [Vicinamibacterales bacterium]|jgi:polyvinyl alcohol dehydrogenase (cytochrome)|nr:PQQ-binding-like beta-propeller repeat protein [Vicinamibacterales bacterium]
MRTTLRPSILAALFVAIALPAAADDGPTMYKQLCASCHDTGAGRAPTRDVLQAMTPERVLTAMESGPMLSMASGRTGVERRAIAEFVTGKMFSAAFSTTPSPQAMCRAASGEFASPLTGPQWNGWGANTQNTRYQDGKMAGLAAGDVSKLKLKWAFGFPGELSADGQSSIAGGRVFVGTQSGTVYALSAATGCVHWTFTAGAAVRAAITIARLESGNRLVAFVGDRAANIYALDANTGALIWKSHVDDHPSARVTASPTYHNGRLYVGVASGEETAGAVAEYECCTFRGSLVALDASTGARVWKTYTIEEPQKRAKNRIGTQQWGPSGAPIWSSPAIDTQKNAVYATTGNNYSGPATDRSDAFVAFDMTSGAIVWSRQMTASDDWNTACRLTDQTNCTNKDAPDFDFASPPILVSLANGRRAIVAGQKSGVVHALDPDRGGEILWQERVGKGGINGGVQWGSASDGSNVYVALSDLARFPVPNSQATIPDPEAGGGMFAFSLDSGKRVWETPAPRACKNRDRCSPAQSAAVSAIPGVVFSGAIDGHLRAYSTTNGSIIWDVDTVQSYKTTNGVPARGGSLNVAGPAISGGTVIINSGYVQNGMPGNALLAYTVDGK